MKCLLLVLPFMILSHRARRVIYGPAVRYLMGGRLVRPRPHPGGSPPTLHLSSGGLGACGNMFAARPPGAHDDDDDLLTLF